eukprot:7641987-Pyramimonas_sp.AAC.1
MSASTRHAGWPGGAARSSRGSLVPTLSQNGNGPPPPPPPPPPTPLPPPSSPPSSHLGPNNFGGAHSPVLSRSA